MTANRKALVAALGFGALTFALAGLLAPSSSPPMLEREFAPQAQFTWPLIAALIVACVSFVAIRLTQR